MTYRAFELQLKKDPVLAKLFPMDLHRTFPLFSLREGGLLLSYAAFAARQGEQGILAADPVCCITVSYPRGTLVSFDRLVPGEGETLLPAADPALVRDLASRREEILSAWEQNAPALPELIRAYNQGLSALLVPAQAEVLARSARQES